MLRGAPITLYPLSHRYFAIAPTLYDLAPSLVDSAVLIKVRPYIRSFPVTDRMLCSGIVGSGHLISELKYLY